MENHKCLDAMTCQEMVRKLIFTDCIKHQPLRTKVVGVFKQFILVEDRKAVFWFNFFTVKNNSQDNSTPIN